MSKANNFPKTEHISEAVVQYVIDNVPDFELRYTIALNTMDYFRTNLYHADIGLCMEIWQAICDYLDIQEGTDEADVILDEIEEVFG